MADGIDLAAIVEEGYAEAHEGALNKLRESFSEAQEARARESELVVQELTQNIADGKEQAIVEMEKRVNMLVKKVNKEEQGVMEALELARQVQAEKRKFDQEATLYTVGSIVAAVGLIGLVVYLQLNYV